MAKHKDPVCGMAVDVVAATPMSAYRGTTYYFCSENCRLEFDNNQAKYAETFKQAAGIPTPKFGSAGSGGAEFERGPTRH